MFPFSLSARWILVMAAVTAASFLTFTPPALRGATSRADARSCSDHGVPGPGHRAVDSID